MIVVDASTVVSAALKSGSIPERALLLAEETGRLAMSASVFAEMAAVLERPRFFGSISPARRRTVLARLQTDAVWFDPRTRVTDCRDPKDDKYLELALEAEAEIIVSGDADLLVLHLWRGIRILRPADFLTSL